MLAVRILERMRIVRKVMKKEIMDPLKKMKGSKTAGMDCFRILKKWRY